MTLNSIKAQLEDLQSHLKDEIEGCEEKTPKTKAEIKATRAKFGLAPTSEDDLATQLKEVRIRVDDALGALVSPNIEAKQPIVLRELAAEETLSTYVKTQLIPSLTDKANGFKTIWKRVPPQFDSVLAGQMAQKIKSICDSTSSVAAKVGVTGIDFDENGEDQVLYGRITGLPGYITFQNRSFKSRLTYNQLIQQHGAQMVFLGCFSGLYGPFVCNFLEAVLQERLFDEADARGNKVSAPIGVLYVLLIPSGTKIEDLKKKKKKKQDGETDQE